MARSFTTFREFLRDEAAGGLVPMGAALVALFVANSPLAPAYFGALKFCIGSLGLLQWINDALKAAFFSLVELKIKCEVPDGHLSTWSLEPFAASPRWVASACPTSDAWCVVALGHRLRNEPLHLAARFDDPSMQDRVKFGFLAGSLFAGLARYLVLPMQQPRRFP